LLPIAVRLDDEGRELPTIDDDWIIEDVSNSEVRIFNPRTQHRLALGADHVHHFTTNPERSHGGIEFGFLTLNVQVFIERTGCSVRPNARPGEPVKPAREEIADKWVDHRYPIDSGIQRRLVDAGYTVTWCNDDKLSRKTELEGWEIVVEPDALGVLSKFRHKDRPYDQTLIKTKAAEREKDNRPTNVKRCLDCGGPLYLAKRGVTTADTVWLCSNKSCPSNRRR